MRKRERERFYRERLAQLRRYTAVFAASDYYAADLMRFLQRAGVKVPEEMSIAGFDDADLCEQVVPPLTSVRQDGRRRAETAIRLLKRMKREPGFSGDVLLPVRLVPRGSTGRLRH